MFCDYISWFIFSHRENLYQCNNKSTKSNQFKYYTLCLHTTIHFPIIITTLSLWKSRIMMTLITSQNDEEKFHFQTFKMIFREYILQDIFVCIHMYLALLYQITATRSNKCWTYKSPLHPKRNLKCSIIIDANSGSTKKL